VISKEGIMKFIKKLFGKKRQFKNGSMVSIVKWFDRIVVQNSAHTISGYNIDYKPFTLLEINASAQILGTILINTLNSNVYKIKDPEFKTKEYNQDRFSAAGVKSEREYMQNARLITLHYYDDILHLTPTINACRTSTQSGGGRFFSAIKEKEIKVEGIIGAEELGTKINNLFEECIVQ